MTIIFSLELKVYFSLTVIASFQHGECFGDCDEVVENEADADGAAETEAEEAPETEVKRR